MNEKINEMGQMPAGVERDQIPQNTIWKRRCAECERELKVVKAVVSGEFPGELLGFLEEEWLSAKTGGDLARETRLFRLMEWVRILRGREGV